MGETKKYATIEEYVAGVEMTPEIRERLVQLLALVKKMAPEAQESMSWQMPGFSLNGYLVHFAVFKNHIGFYPGASGVANFTNELAGYKTSKGAIQLPNTKPVPFDLIEKIVRFRIEENLQLGK